jgi:hypothetical protein
MIANSPDAALAARERREEILALHVAQCSGYPLRRSLLGQFRRWLGAQLRRRADASTQPDTALSAIAASRQLILALAAGVAFGLTVHDAGAVAGRAPDPRRHAIDVAAPDPLTPSAFACFVRQPCPTQE